MAGKKLVKGLAEEVKKWGCMKQTGVSLKQMMNFGDHISSKNLLISAKFVHKELPIRIARRVLELEDLPYGLSKKHGVVKMKKWSYMKQNGVRIARRVLELQDLPYGLSSKLGVVKVPDLHLDSFHVLQSYPEIKDKNDEFKFTKMVKTITLRHNNVVPMMALGVKQLKKEQPQFSYEDLGKIQQLLDRFYMSKIGLIGQHLPLHGPNPLLNSVGYINAKMSPLEVARDASKDAQGIRLH